MMRSSEIAKIDLPQIIMMRTLNFEINWADYNVLMSKPIRIERDNYSRTRRYERTHARTPNQNQKLNGRNIRTALLHRSVREIPFGIDKMNGSHAQRTHKSK